LDPCTYQKFDRAYQDSVQQVLGYWTREMQVELAAHCYGWHPDRFDFCRYLQASSPRYYRAYSSLCELTEGRSICDVGGFWGVLPLTFQRLGCEVTMTESLKFYSDSFHKLFNFVRTKGVTIVDMDPFEPITSPVGTFDLVTVMAVLEHYPHSPKPLLDNVVAMLKRNGAIYLEVPNIAYWPKRMALLRGQTPLVPIQDIVSSSIPFIGHHHEYTIAELRTLVGHLDLRIVKEEFYNYSQAGSVIRQFFRHPLQTFAFWAWPDTRECLAVACTLRSNENVHGDHLGGHLDVPE
jgi:2-polyprenyl-3-methyl-5-hydroxy-6-metoxy-1,4-benzoquinol methylase